MRLSSGLIGITLLMTVVAISIDEQCRHADSCESCLNAHLECAWCTDKTYQVRYRCFTRSQLLSLNCSENEIYENQPVMEVLQQKPLRDYETTNDQAVQVTPQLLYLKLVKGDAYQQSMIVIVVVLVLSVGITGVH